MISIYVLQLQDNKYYIGRTTKTEFRLNTHFNPCKSGSAWTDKYLPLEVVQIYHNCDNYDEDKYTLQYMEKYGINNVRGGSFCQIKLSEENKEIIKKMLNNSNDRCFICGLDDHFAKDCSNDVDEVKSLFSQFTGIAKSFIRQISSLFFSPSKNDELLNSSPKDESIINCEYCNISFSSQLELNSHLSTCSIKLNLLQKLKQESSYQCEYCQKEILKEEKSLHNKNCPIKLKLQSQLKQNIKHPCQFCDRLFDTQKGATYHEVKYCKKNPTNQTSDDVWKCQYCDKTYDTKRGAMFHETKYCKKNPNNIETRKKLTCFNCGKMGHWAKDCYSTSKKNKYYC